MSRGQRLAPVWLVEFADSGHGYELRLQVLGECDQTIHVPSAQARCAWPEVILLAHALRVRSNGEVEGPHRSVRRRRARTISRRPRRTTTGASRPPPTIVRSHRAFAFPQRA